MKTLRQLHLHPALTSLAVFGLALLLLAPASASAQTVNTCQSGSAGAIEVTTCLVGNASTLTGSASGSVVGYPPVEWGIDLQMYDGSNLVGDTGEPGYSYVSYTVTPNLGDTYTATGWVDECFGLYGGQCEYWSDHMYSVSAKAQDGQAPAGVQGFLNPKYKVVGIVYAVPGEQSYVSYTDTTMMGSNTSTSSSFSTNTTTSVSICGSTGSNVCGQGNGVAVTGTYTNAFTQESDSSYSFAVNQTDAFVNQVSPTTGPCLDHGNDVVYVWVNPNVWFTTTGAGAPLQWNGYTYDLSDDSENMEVIPLRLRELQNPSLIDSYRLQRLQRAWALSNVDGSSPAITNQDLLNIAGQDPFSNPNYAIIYGSDYQTTTDDRFMQSSNIPLWYLPGETNEYDWSYSTTTTAGQGGKTTYSDGFAIEAKFAGSFFWQSVSYDLKNSETFTWIDQWNNLMTQMLGESAKVHIVGPSVYGCADEYNVFQDNVYGTFMVAPVE